jgi:predicted nucleotidyltransferase
LQTVGIICEYNPLHRGHEKQLRLVRQLGGEGIVCLMSGNFVQRGAPAIIDKSLRAAAAMECGADLVLELPLTAALSSAEGFAREGVRLLGGFCDALCFGAETADSALLLSAAEALLSDGFSPALRQQLDKGLSFPVARSHALAQLGMDPSILDTPNNILGVEYCKAILASGCGMKPMVIHRGGDYHATDADPDNPSATAIRQRMICEESWESLVPEAVRSIFRGASVHTLAAGERAVLAKLRTMRDEDFEALPYGSEGLWRKLMHLSRTLTDLEQIAAGVKSKRYTRTRIDRMILCAFLGLTEDMLASPAPYARILGFTKQGQQVLHRAKQQTTLYNVGQRVDSPQWAIEQRCNDLYGLFADRPESAGMEPKRRVILYHDRME